MSFPQRLIEGYGAFTSGRLPRRTRRHSPCYVHADVDVVHVIADGGHPAHEVPNQQHGIKLVCQTEAAPVNCGSVEVVYGGGDHVDNDSVGRGDWFVDIE